MPVGEIGILESVLAIVDGNIVYASGPYTDLEQPD
jgi:hypothetical protein